MEKKEGREIERKRMKVDRREEMEERKKMV